VPGRRDGLAHGRVAQGHRGQAHRHPRVPHPGPRQPRPLPRHRRVPLLRAGDAQQPAPGDPADRRADAVPLLPPDPLPQPRRRARGIPLIHPAPPLPETATAARPPPWTAVAPRPLTSRHREAELTHLRSTSSADVTARDEDSLLPAAVVGIVVGFLAQPLALAFLGTGWAAAYNVSGGECCYDGTCSDEGAMTVAVWAWFVLVGA